jgi:hypothetical protein
VVATQRVYPQMSQINADDCCFPTLFLSVVVLFDFASRYLLYYTIVFLISVFICAICGRYVWFICVISRLSVNVSKIQIYFPATNLPNSAPHTTPA